MYGLLIANTWAQEVPPAQQHPIMNMVPLILVFIIFYVFVLLPSKKRGQQAEKYINSLQKGEEVYTKAGILGRIAGLTDKVVTLELEGGVRMKVLRSQIGGPSKQILFEPKKDTK